MNVEYEKGLNRVCLHINVPELYEEDYQMPMLRENNIEGMLTVDGCGIDGESRYTYDIAGLVSMEALFENKKVGQRDIQEFITCLLSTVKELRKHMLNPGCLILEPDSIFCRKQKYFFCYLPGRSMELCEAFHQITEYFVRKLDYEDEEGITLAYELHKATLQENYDLERIMQEYQMEEEETEEEEQDESDEIDDLEDSDAMIFTLDEEEYQPMSQPSTIREEGGRWSAWRKAANKISKGRIGKWGSWDDLILETDGQEK